MLAQSLVTALTSVWLDVYIVYMCRCAQGCVGVGVLTVFSYAEGFPYVTVAGCVDSVLLVAVRVTGMYRHEEKVRKCELVSR